MECPFCKKHEGKEMWGFETTNYPVARKDGAVLFVKIQFGICRMCSKAPRSEIKLHAEKLMGHKVQIAFDIFEIKE